SSSVKQRRCPPPAAYPRFRFASKGHIVGSAHRGVSAPIAFRDAVRVSFDLPTGSILQRITGIDRPVCPDGSSPGSTHRGHHTSRCAYDGSGCGGGSEERGRRSSAQWTKKTPTWKSVSQTCGRFVN